jgi:folate-dependent phosphoribosylglycinamide formyltransferase PurN
LGSGSPYSVAALEAFHRERRVEMLVVPRMQTRNPLVRLIAWWFGRALRMRARREGIAIVAFDPHDAPQADFFCVASFPFLLKRAALSRARLGALNAHPALLPRHRGVDPIFWTYFHDDRETGVTVHWMTDGVDAGDIAAQERIAVPRGMPRRALEIEMGRAAGRLLARAVSEIENRVERRAPQDESIATHEPMPSRTKWTIDFTTWPAERVWHFLRGVGTSRFLAGDAERFVLDSHDQPPGAFDGRRLYCVDGWVELGKPTLRRRVRHMLFKARS